MSRFVERGRTAGARVDGSIDLDYFPLLRTGINQFFHRADLTFDIRELQVHGLAQHEHGVAHAELSLVGLFVDECGCQSAFVGLNLGKSSDAFFGKLERSNV